MSEEPVLAIDPVLEPRAVRAALVWGLGLSACVPSAGPSASLASLLETVAAEGEAYLAPGRKAVVRDMLRHGVYKPAGRAKPSSEYLLAAALAGDFPYVNGPVDANNEVSLQWGYPASIFDLRLTGRELQLSRGRSGERYVFNPAGQEIDLEDLIVVRHRAGDAWEACGNPVKDAMATKVFESARDVAGVVYAPMAESSADLEACAVRFAEILKNACGAAETGYRII
jgi:DNA/RNA-binding domain of Phe-tRNA-synthetase-like protein